VHSYGKGSSKVTGGSEAGQRLAEILVQPQQLSRDCIYRLFQRTEEERGGRAGEEVGRNLFS